MPSQLIRLNSVLAGRRFSFRSSVRRLAWIAVALTVTLQSPTYAQVASDALVQLDMLDTPTDDLLRLATSYADAVRDLKVARLSIETVQALRPSAVVTNLEVQIANLNMEAAQRKVTIIRAIVEKQLAAAENKLVVVRFLERTFGSALGKNDKTDDRNFIRANDEATVKILKMILAMN